MQAHTGTSRTGRHHRQEILQAVGPQGQAKLRAGHALLVGSGALGCVVADALCRAGVGTVTIVDRDTVEHTNLQRQSLFTTANADAQDPKAIAAETRLCAIDPAVHVRAIADDFRPAVAEAIFRGADPTGRNTDSHHPPPPVGVIVDGTDNFQTRFVLNDLAVKHGVPFVYGGAVKTGGAAATIIPGTTACLRCMLDEPPAPGSVATCDTAGVLGPAVTVIAAVQAAETIKVLLGAIDTVQQGVLEIDLWTNHVRRSNPLPKRNACPCCGTRRFDFLDGRDGGGTHTLCGEGRRVQVQPSGNRPVDLPAAAATLKRHGDVETTDGAIRCRLHDAGGDEGGVEITLFASGRAIFRGVDAPERARALYAKYVGA